MKKRDFRFSTILGFTAFIVVSSILGCMKPGDGVGLDSQGKLLPPKPAFSYASPVLDTTGFSASHTPVSTGGLITTYSAASLPAGLSINPATGVISGIPTMPAAAGDFTVNGVGATGSTSAVINITIRDRCTLIPNPCFAAPNVTYGIAKIDTIGKIYSHSPDFSLGGTITSYAISGSALPAGLALDPITGIISGTPTTATAAANYSILVTGPGGSVTPVINIQVVPILPVNFFDLSVQPIFTNFCRSCHNPATGVGFQATGLDLSIPDAYDSLVNKRAFETPVEQLMRVLPGKSDSSYMYLKIFGTPTVGNTQTRMPLGGPYLSPAQIAVIKRWIDAGAPRN